MSDEHTTDPTDALAAARARRAELREANERARAEQELKDLAAIEDLEILHGVANIATVRVNFSPGLPALVAVRCPEPPEMKRYHDTIKPSKKGDIGDPLAAAGQLGRACLVYPERDDPMRDALFTQRPGVDTDLGNEAHKLVAIKAEDEGKG